MSDAMILTGPPHVRVGMGIHRAPADVFAAFTEPGTTKQFWIVESSGPLEPGASVTWDFDAAGARASINVRHFEPAERLVFDWGGPGAMSTVDIGFSPWRDGGCHVEITETGFDGTADELAAHAADSTGGFTMVLCSLKALLEHGIELGAVTDRA